MDDLLVRTRLLLGEEKLSRLQSKTVLIAGLGGVGGTALECLARSGITHFILVDDDTVNATNLNRQILFTAESIGQKKTEAAKTRLLSINPSIQVTLISERITPENTLWSEGLEYDGLIDAIDSVQGKAFLVELALKHQVPFVLSLGMAKRLDPQKVITTTLDQTHHDPLAKSLRNLLRKKDLRTEDIPVVFSLEEPLNHERTPASMMMVPSAAGLQLAAYLIRCFTKTE